MRSSHCTDIFSTLFEGKAVYLCLPGKRSDLWFQVNCCSFLVSKCYYSEKIELITTGLPLLYAAPALRTYDIQTIAWSDIHNGKVVLINGYKIGLTVLALAETIRDAAVFRPLNPLSAYFYTNIYRWFLRHMSIYPEWLNGQGSASYPETHKVWNKRFYYMDSFVPKWMRRMFPWVSRQEWKKEESEFKKFKVLVEPSFSKHYRFPEHYQSIETVENLDTSSEVSKP